MHIEFLHNPPLNKKANEILNDLDFPNENIFLPSTAKENKAKILQKIGKKDALQIGFDSLSLQGLFAHLAKRFDSKICHGIGNHQQVFLAASMLGSLEISLLKDGSIDFDLLNQAIIAGCKVFVFPSINQDIFSLNDLREVFGFIKDRIDDFCLIWDVSLSFLQGYNPDFMDDRIAYLVNAEMVGLTRGLGAFFYSLDLGFCHISEGARFFEALDCALKDCCVFLDKKNIEEFNRDKLLKHLEESLGESISLFIPIENSAPNTLALRFAGIKARLLLQDLFIKEVYGANGQECLFGLFRPSFVLQKMGYSENESRELISFSIKSACDPQKLALMLAQSYRQIKAMGL